MKKKLLVGAAVGTVGLVALMGATFAQSESENPGNSVRERVAEILGVEPEELEEAYDQARDEHRDEQTAARLSAAVEAGTISQEQADAITAWLDAMPEVLDDVAGHGRHGSLGRLISAADDETMITALVDRLLAAEKITEDDVEAVTAWLKDAPTEALESLGVDTSKGHGHRGFRGRGFGHGHHGGLFEGRFKIIPYAPSDDAETNGTVVTPAVVAGESA